MTFTTFITSVFNTVTFFKSFVKFRSSTAIVMVNAIRLKLPNNNNRINKYINKMYGDCDGDDIGEMQ